jgi:hypothetical protein
VYSLVHLSSILTAHCVLLLVAVLLVYLGVAMCVALFSKNENRAERARIIFDHLLGLLRWWSR